MNNEESYFGDKSRNDSDLQRRRSVDSRYRIAGWSVCRDSGKDR